MGEYRQLQFTQIPDIPTAVTIIYEQYLGEPTVAVELARKKYFQMKCCSLQQKDLDYHYQRMSKLFYQLNGFNDPNLKHIFMASLPKELHPEMQRQLTASQLAIDIDNLSLGKLYQLAIGSLEKLCEHKEFFTELLKNKHPFQKACKKPNLAIKCNDDKTCICPTKKKHHYKSYPDKDPNTEPTLDLKR